jgi:anti-sigma regulatory factor (Ser/Thr protein kinase)
MPHRLTQEELLRLGPARTKVVLSRPEALRRARRQVRELARGVLHGERLDDALLLTGEVTTNALLHGGPGPITLWAGVDERRLRVEVHDGGTGLPPGFVPVAARPDELGGRGLQLVEALSDRWGHRSGRWAAIWFEIDLA